MPIQIYVVASFFVYALFLITLLDTKPAPTAAHLGTWIVALVLELIILGASLAVYTGKHREPQAGNPVGGKLRKRITEWEIVEVVTDLVRILFLLALTSFYLVFVYRRHSQQLQVRLENAGEPGETTGLLNGSQAENGTANGHPYGSVSPLQKDAHSEPPPAGWSRPTTSPSKSWWEYIRGYSLFFPYLWPAKSRHLQIVVILCFGLVTLQRVINVLVPSQVGVITDILSGENGPTWKVPWGPICLFVLYRVLQGGTGLLGALRSTLWIPIGQYSYKELSTAAFEHVHSLSLDFHLGKRTGEVLSALSKGNSINTFLEQVTFQVLPMLIDLAVAIGYFLIYFDAYYALVVAIVTFCYLYITIRMAQWRAEIRREMVNYSRQEDAVKYVIPRSRGLMLFTDWCFKE